MEGEAENGVQESSASVEPSASVPLGDPSDLPEQILREMTVWRRLVVYTAFVMLGMINLMPWNAMLNSLPSILDKIYGGTSFQKIITATYTTSLLLVTVPFLVCRCVRYSFLQISIYAVSVCIFFFAVVCQWVVNKALAEAFLAIIGFCVGALGAVVGATAMGFAADVHPIYAGACSAGMGLAGLWTFGVWMVVTYGIFDADKASGVKSSVWAMVIMIIIPNLIGLVCCYFVFGSGDIKRILVIRDEEKNAAAQYKSPTAVQDNASQMDDYDIFEDQGIWGLYKRCWVPCASILLCFIVTLLLFPDVGPLAWSNLSAVQRDTLIGIFQAGDLIGRYTPSVTNLTVKNRYLLGCIQLSRLLFIATFILSQHIGPSSPFWRNLAVEIIQMALLSISNGWSASCAFMMSGDNVPGSGAKQKAQSLTLAHCFIGIVIGQWTGTAIA